MFCNLCDEITYPFPNFNGFTVEVWEWICDFVPHNLTYEDDLSMLRLKLIHVSKSGPRCLPMLLSVCSYYGDVIMSAMVSQITVVSFVCSTVCSGADQRKHQSSAWLAFVRGIHRWPVDSPNKWPVTWKMSKWCRDVNFSILQTCREIVYIYIYSTTKIQRFKRYHHGLNHYYRQVSSIRRTLIGN